MSVVSSAFRNGLLLQILSGNLALVPEQVEFCTRSYTGHWRVIVRDDAGGFHIGRCAIGQRLNDAGWVPTFAIWSSPEAVAGYPFVVDEGGRLQLRASQ